MKHRRTHVSPVDTSSALVNVVARTADAGHLENALHLLAAANQNTNETRNARGVCLMRIGRISDAVRTLRSLVLAPNCTWMKPDLPVIYGANFVTALLLAGQPGGGRDLLREIAQQEHPSVIRLWEALKDWERGLTWWQWLNWKTGLVPDVPIELKFVPGEFADPIVTTPTVTPPVEAGDAAKTQAV